MNDQKEINSIIERIPDYERDKIYYTVALNFWVATALEKEKRLIILSSAGVGFIIHFLSTDLIFGTLDIICLKTGIACFSLCIIFGIITFDWNKKQIESIISGDLKNKSEMVCSERCCFGFFMLGVLAMMCFGIFY